jgi:ribosomal protein S18 acetylase RimI-like enzyme
MPLAKGLTMGILYRRATADDALALAAIHCQSWRETYPGVLPQPVIDAWAVEPLRAESWKRSFAKGQHFVWVAVHDDRTVGYASGGASDLDQMRDDGGAACSGQLFALYVLNTAKRMGIGRRLIELIWSDLRDAGHCLVRVEVIKGNLPAIAFYKSLGAQLIRETTFELNNTLLPTFVYGWLNLQIKTIEPDKPISTQALLPAAIARSDRSDIA